jgi:hypothetical protein
VEVEEILLKIGDLANQADQVAAVLDSGEVVEQETNHLSHHHKEQTVGDPLVILEDGLEAAAVAAGPTVAAVLVVIGPLVVQAVVAALCQYGQHL